MRARVAAAGSSVGHRALRLVALAYLNRGVLISDSAWACRVAARDLPTFAPGEFPLAVATTSATGPRAATSLLADDDQAMRRLLRRMLERAGFAVVLAANGRDAMDRLRERPVDLVVTDMVMPEMDGIELIRILAAEQPALPIIAIGGVHDGANYLGMAMRLGARAAIQKPVGAAALVEAVRRLLADARTPAR